jgi:cell cycle checkpoint protein
VCSFNPIAPTLLKKALQALLSTHFSSSSMSPPKGLLDTIVESSNGDIRSAIMGLQFACSTLFGSGKKSKGKGGKKAATEASKMIALTNREQSLQLFHLMGKVLYNKRKIFRQTIIRQA